MQLARVIGDVVVTRKDDQLTGLKLLVVQPLTPDRQPSGRALVAVDAVGAGVGEGSEELERALDALDAIAVVCGHKQCSSIPNVQG